MCPGCPVTSRARTWRRVPAATEAALRRRLRPAGPYPGGGIFPVPGQGPPGAVAAVGAIVPGMGGAGGAMTNGRTSIKFTGPAGMKMTWQLPDGDFNDEASGLTAPKEYNFLQGQVYRLRLTQVLPNHPGKSFYPTLEVAAGNPKTITFLAHASVPLTFTNEDFDQAVAGNLVVKVIYLPDRENQDFATVAGAEELVSTRLEPGADPVAEAQRRGTILADRPARQHRPGEPRVAGDDGPASGHDVAASRDDDASGHDAAADWSRRARWTGRPAARLRCGACRRASARFAGPVAPPKPPARRRIPTALPSFIK